MNFKDKKIIITGATGGIGGCLVKKFIEFDSNILATGTNVEKLSIMKNNFKFTNAKNTIIENEISVKENSFVFL